MDDAFATIARNALKNETEEELYIPGEGGAGLIYHWLSLGAFESAELRGRGPLSWGGHTMRFGDRRELHLCAGAVSREVPHLLAWRGVVQRLAAPLPPEAGCLATHACHVHPSPLPCRDGGCQCRSRPPPAAVGLLLSVPPCCVAPQLHHSNGSSSSSMILGSGFAPAGSSPAPVGGSADGATGRTHPCFLAHPFCMTRV